MSQIKPLYSMLLKQNLEVTRTKYDILSKFYGYLTKRDSFEPTPKICTAACLYILELSNHSTNMETLKWGNRGNNPFLAFLDPERSNVG